MYTKRNCARCGKEYKDNIENFPTQTAREGKLSSYCRKCHIDLSKKTTHNRYGIAKKIYKNIYSNPGNAKSSIPTKGLRKYGKQDKAKSISLYQYLSGKKKENNEKN